MSNEKFLNDGWETLQEQEKVDWRLMVVHKIYSNHIQDFVDEEKYLPIGTITTLFLSKKKFYINLWPTFHNYVLSHGAVTNNYGGLLDNQRSHNYVRYHTSSNNNINQMISKLIRAVNSGSDILIYLHKEYELTMAYSMYCFKLGNCIC